MNDLYCNNKTSGFTLLEMVISIGIFAVVVVTSIGLMISLSNAQIKASNTQEIQDNLRFSLELMTKEMRTGSNFSISPVVCGAAGSEIHFDATSGRRVYFLDSANQRIMRVKLSSPYTPPDITSLDCNGSTGKAVPFSADELFIDRLNFITQGLRVGSSDGQPVITIVIHARSQSAKAQLQSASNIQTTVVPRLRDLP